MDPITRKTTKQATKLLLVALPRDTGQSGCDQSHPDRLSDQVPAATGGHDGRARLRRILIAHMSP
jgi:hypothetical protein